MRQICSVTNTCIRETGQPGACQQPAGSAYAGLLAIATAPLFDLERLVYARLKPFFRARGLLCGALRFRTCTQKGYADPHRASQALLDYVGRGGTGSQREAAL